MARACTLGYVVSLKIGFANSLATMVVTSLNTASRQISEGGQRWVGLVLGWVTSLEQDLLGTPDAVGCLFLRWNDANTLSLSLKAGYGPYTCELSAVLLASRHNP